MSKILENIIKNTDDNDKDQDKMIFITYQGKMSEKFEQSLLKSKRHANCIYCRLPLTPPVEKSLSDVVYQVKCPRCNARAVQTS